MGKFLLTNKAVEDLNSIWKYTFDMWSEQQADKYYFSLLDTCQDLARNPNLGKSYDEISRNLLGLKINKHIIFYRQLDGSTIEITRILHERMELKTRIAE